MRSFAIVILSLSTSLFAQVNQKLPNAQWAYYGADFYQKFPSRIDKDFLSKILNESHSTVKGKLDTITSQCQGLCYKSISVGYDNARKILFGELDIQRDSRGTFVEDVYCDKKFYFRNVADAANMHSQVNIEHTWPQSKFNPSLDKNTQKSDLHHLFLADSMANNRRANNAFGDIGQNVDELNVDKCEISGLFQSPNGMLFSPPKVHRGNVARALFYFATRYKLPISADQIKVLKVWNTSDPVDQAEKNRHEIIAKYQNVRNPFVDYPELVGQVSGF